MVTVGILGASGYTGADFIRLAARHPDLRLGPLVASSNAGQQLAAVFPHLGGVADAPLLAIGDADFAACDVVVSALPHGASQDIVKTLPRHVRIVDMSADFRLRDTATYVAWYGRSHDAPDLLAGAVYGLTERNRTAIAAAHLVACPGCYPTATLLALLPLIEAGAIDSADIVVDAKSGVSGAGRSVKQSLLFAEAGEGVSPYGIASHRHAPEIEQELSLAAGRPVAISFTPHLVPMARGELVTCYARGDYALAERALRERYAGEPFIRLAPPSHPPATQMVRGSNMCLIGLYADRVPGRLIVVAAIDNLVKGSAGQAMQNLNLMCGLPETRGLGQIALFP